RRRRAGWRWHGSSRYITACAGRTGAGSNGSGGPSTPSLALRRLFQAEAPFSAEHLLFLTGFRSIFPRAICRLLPGRCVSTWGRVYALPRHGSCDMTLFLIMAGLALLAWAIYAFNRLVRL